MTGPEFALFAFCLWLTITLLGVNETRKEIRDRRRRSLARRRVAQPRHVRIVERPDQ